MSTVLHKMLERTGKSVTDFRSNSQLGEIFRSSGVRSTPEFERIKFLPRRVWESQIDAEYLRRLSAHLRAPGGKMTLRPAQAAVLTEAYDFGGSFVQLGVGEGKTLITAVLPTLKGSERPVLLAPAKLRKKTVRDFERLRKDWMVHPRIEFISYEMLSRKKQADVLFEIKPDLIMADEAHALRNLSSSRTKRVKRFMAENPQVPFVPLSGTFAKRSLLDFWHLLMWSMKTQLMPLPKIHSEVMEWALAVDEKVEEEKRVRPGALLELIGQKPDKWEELDDLKKARIAVRDRLKSTPGVIITSSSQNVDASISIELIYPPRCEELDQAINLLRTDFITPDGIDLTLEIESARQRYLTLWRHARQLSCGFFYRWDPSPPVPWLEARRNWGRYVRHILDNSSKLDSPQQVEHAVLKQELVTPFRIPDPTKPPESGLTIKVTPQKLLAAWLVQRPTFKPHAKANWVNDQHLRWILNTHVKDAPPTVLWVEHIAVGERLSKISGFPFCHINASDANGRYIEDLSGHVIASVASCGEGVNLQFKWARNIVISAPPNGPAWEQMLGRTHRPGQDADTVEVLVLSACDEQEQGFLQAVRDARLAEDGLGQQQKLLLADRVNWDG
jgi:hypothetical protein